METAREIRRWWRKREHRELEDEIVRLSRELRKQTARADKMQNDARALADAVAWRFSPR